MNKYEALEAMLQNTLEHGTDIETLLAEFPEFSAELRPLLEAAMDAQSASVPAASDDVVRRGRTRLLQHAAQIRDAAPAPRASLFNFRLATVALTLLLVFFVGGTGLVRASNSALPGDGLYTVKRGWENTRVWFADDDESTRLQAEYEEERREEVQELLAYSRVAIIRFEGVVTLLDGSKWEVAGVPVIVSDQTDIDADIRIGSDVIVSGRTESDGVVFANEITLSHPENENSVAPTEMPAEDLDEPEEVETPESEEDGAETPEPEDDEEQNDDDEAEDDGESDGDGETDSDGESDGDNESGDDGEAGGDGETDDDDESDGDGETDDDDESDDDEPDDDDESDDDETDD